VPESKGGNSNDSNSPMKITPLSEEEKMV